MILPCMDNLVISPDQYVINCSQMLRDYAKRSQFDIGMNTAHTVAEPIQLSNLKRIL